MDSKDHYIRRGIWVALLLCLQFAAGFGAWGRGFPGGLLLEIRQGGLPRAAGALVGANLIPIVVLYFAYPIRRVMLRRSVMALALLTISLSFIPHPGRVRELFGPRYTHSLPIGEKLPPWAAATREKQLAEMVEGTAAEEEWDWGDPREQQVPGVLERIFSTAFNVRAGLVYNVVRNIGGLGYSGELLRIPLAGALKGWSDTYLLRHPHLVPVSD